jgi:uncharacterized membrane protein
MLSNHYPLAFGTAYNWVIASLVFLMGVTIRHWFNSKHARKGSPTWTWIVTLVIFIVIMWLSTVPRQTTEDGAEAAGAAAPAFAAFAADVHFNEARDTVQGRCSMCHAAEPVWEGIHRAPKGVLLETDAEIAAHAREIYLQSGRSHAMPPGNLTAMTESERALINAWYESAAYGADR